MSDGYWQQEARMRFERGDLTWELILPDYTVNRTVRILEQAGWVEVDREETWDSHMRMNTTFIVTFESHL